MALVSSYMTGGVEVYLFLEHPGVVPGASEGTDEVGDVAYGPGGHLPRSHPVYHGQELGMLVPAQWQLLAGTWGHR